MKRFGVVFCVASLVVALAACGSSAKKATSTTTKPKVPAITVDSFTSDFSVMSQLAGLASAGKGKIGVLLPETTTSARYTSFDAPYLTKAFQKAGLSASQYKIDNAQGSPATQKTQAEADITEGATVLLVDPIDSGVGAAIEAAAKAQGVKVIDYDRITLGGTRDYYVSFDNVKVGELIGKGEVQCIQDWNVQKPQILILDGAATDNNATLFAQGYNSVLKPHFDSGEYVKVGEPAGSWEPSQVLTTFTQQYTAHPNINATVVANDANGNAVISQLKTLQITPKTFPVTGQDAQLTGVQNILAGYQCMTVYKPIYLEAQAAVALALYLRAGQTPPAGLVNGTTKDTTAKTDVQSVLLTPTSVDLSNLASTVIKDNFVTAADACTGSFKSLCEQAGIPTS
jgi:ABC-type xylose transport system, periplasmic component